MTKIREERKAEGVCLYCGDPLDRDGQYCTVCREKANDMKYVSTRKAVERGRCGYCYKPRDRDGWLCSECNEKAKARQLSKHKARKEQGLCPQCGNVSEPGFVFCMRCRMMKREWIAMKRAEQKGVDGK